MATLSPAKKSKRNRALEKKLVAYSAATLVAQAVPGRALAQVQYTDVTPDQGIGFHGSYDIDFDGDGNAEFRLWHSTHTSTSQVITTTTSYYECVTDLGYTYFCVNTNTNTNTLTFTRNSVYLSSHFGAGDYGLSVMANSGSYTNYAAALNAGATISSGQNFQPLDLVRPLAFDHTRFGDRGPWVGKTDKFLGLRFNLADGAGGTTTHYGWVRLDVAGDVSSFTVKSFAYEDVEGQAITAGELPLEVALSGFTAAPSDSGVLLVWETTSELDNAGFNLLRSTDAATEDELINEALIASEAPGSNTGAAYQWLDATAEAGTSYYYWLEAVDVNGGTERFGPVSAIIQVPTAISLSTLSANTSTLPQWQWVAFGVAALGAVLRRRVARRRQMRQRATRQQPA